MKSKRDLTHQIKLKAKELGFAKIGITQAVETPAEYLRLNNWVGNSFHGQMKWLDNTIEKRGNIFNYFSDSKSVISLGFNYFTGSSEDYWEVGKISNYAWGDDYHSYLKSKLYELLDFIKSSKDGINGLVCVDTSPVMEKVWAQKAGLGWIGKHTNLITQDFGSWIFLGEVILDCDLVFDTPFLNDLCGTCTACIDSCPTQALQPYIIDSNKCISYLTIEYRESFSKDMDMHNWIYGCDICQEVCPWNIKFKKISTDLSFQVRPDIKDKKITDWLEISELDFRKIFKNSSMKRTKYKGLIRNVKKILT